MSGFDKFEWMDAVSSDTRLPVAERFLLALAAFKYAYKSKDLFCVRQTTIAARFNVSDRMVRKAISAAKQLGYIVPAEPRQRGRGHCRADEYRLVIPEHCAGISDVNTGTDWSKYRNGLVEIPERSSPYQGKRHP